MEWIWLSPCLRSKILFIFYEEYFVLIGCRVFLSQCSIFCYIARIYTHETSWIAPTPTCDSCDLSDLCLLTWPCLEAHTHAHTHRASILLQQAVYSAEQGACSCGAASLSLKANSAAVFGVHNLLQGVLTVREKKQPLGLKLILIAVVLPC